MEKTEGGEGMGEGEKKEQQIDGNTFPVEDLGFNKSRNTK